jgi:hypothetical protein
MKSKSERCNKADIRSKYRAGVNTPLRQAGWVRVAALMALLSLMFSQPNRSALAQAPAINEPPVAPHSILAFPQRSFVSTSGFSINDRVRVDIIHPSGAVVSSQDATPQDDPATPTFDGIVEINHPGGVCWLVKTPDMRPGDKVRTTATNSVTGAVVVDQTTISNVTCAFATDKNPDGTALPAGTVQVHGTAQNAAGAPLPLAALEQRLVSGGNPFELNGRRTLRATSAAGNDGTLSYDPIGANNPAGIKWTATYTGLSAADITRAKGAESRIMWLGANPGAGVEQTIYEVGADIVKAPSAPCTAPLEVLPPPPGSELNPPSVPQNLAATVSGNNTVTLTWSPSVDAEGPIASYGIIRNGVALFNVDGSTTTYVDLNVPAGTYTYTVNAVDLVGNRSADSAPATATTTLQPAGNVTVHEPPVAPISIIAFPARDFTSSEGYIASDTVSVQVIRNGFVISTASGLVPVDDPTTPIFDGTVEVNHPGGGCWQGVTPDIRPGDIIRQIAFNPDGTVRTADQTTVSNLTAFRPVVVHAATPGLNDGIIEVHGEAMNKNGTPIDLGAIEQRLVAPRDAFDLNGRRTLRAASSPIDGVMSYDVVNNPTGTKWTARYTGLNENDVARAVGGTTSTGRTFPGAETRIQWLGADTLAGTELTIYENADAAAPGPSAPCGAPLEPLDTAAPSVPVLQAVRSGARDVQLTWTASTDNVAVFGYGIYRDGVRIRNVGPTPASYLDANVPAGNHTYTVDAIDSASTQAPDGTYASRGQAWGNRSAQSNAVSILMPDTTAPTVPQNLVATTSLSNVTLTWSASTDDVGVAGYRVYRGGVVLADVSGTATTYTDTVAAAGTYTYTVDAVDAVGNRSAQSASATANVTAVADTTPPSQVTGLRAVTLDVHTRDVTLNWAASTDDVGVTSYGIYRRNAFPASNAFMKIADVGGSVLTFSDPNLPAGTYDYAVDAADSAGNRSARSASARVVTANDPPVGPHSIIPFPQRDFISSTGYAVSEGPVVISLIRKDPATNLWVEVVHSTPINVVEDPATPGRGVVEVNHPGGGCWVDITPDVVPGDVIRFTNNVGVADQTTVANVTTERATDKDANGNPLPAGTIQVHGTAQDASGTPLPVAQVENRIIASSADPFQINGRRDLRAGAAAIDGTLSYDPVGPNNLAGIKWTATYVNLNAHDVSLALASEARAVWLGRDPLALVELTIFENGPGVTGGPAAPCTAPAAPAPGATVAPSSLNFGNVGVNTTSAARTVTLTNSGTGALTISSVAISGSSDFSIGANTCSGSLAAGASCTTSLTFRPSAAGARAATLTYTDNAANSPTQSVALSGTGVDGTAPSVTAPTQSFVVPASITVLSPLSNSTVPMALAWSATDPGGSGIASYELQQSVNGGAFTSVQLPAPTATSITLNLKGGTFNAPISYKFQVRATDGAGNVSAWTPGQTFTLSLLDDTAAGPVTYQGGWSTGSVTGSYGGAVHFATQPGPRANLNKVSFTFTGSATWFSTVGPDRGQASVSVDGGAPFTVDLYSPTVQPARIAAAITNIASGTHTVTITVLGTKATASSGTRVDIDGFALQR